jgi:hypothetical protein
MHGKQNKTKKTRLFIYLSVDIYISKQNKKKFSFNSFILNKKKHLIQ